MISTEAITWLSQLSAGIEWEVDMHYAEAIDMAIEALKAQNATDTNVGSNVLIRRQDVEQTVEDNILCYTHSDRPIDQDPDTECHRAIRTALRMLRKDLRKLPSAQPEIIRCKDCRYYQDNNGGYPHMNCKWDANETPDADDFCSGVERRTDERSD